MAQDDERNGPEQAGRVDNLGSEWTAGGMGWVHPGMGDKGGTGLDSTTQASQARSQKRPRRLARSACL